MVCEDDYGKVVVLGVYTDTELLLEHFRSRGIILTRDGAKGYQFSRGMYHIYAVRTAINALAI